MHTLAHAHKCTHTGTLLHMQSHTHMHTSAHRHTLSHTHAHTHSHTYKCTHTHRHTLSHTRTRSLFATARKIKCICQRHKINVEINCAFLSSQGFFVTSYLLSPVTAPHKHTHMWPPTGAWTTSLGDNAASLCSH